jgi:hypothetical protein
MKSLFDPSFLARIRARIEGLSPESERRWGTMRVEQMLVHSTDQLRLAFGEIPCRPRKTVFGRFPLRQLLIYVLPWPKGAPTLPELRDPPPREEWDAAKESLLASIDRFVALGPNHAWEPHPAFGKLSGRAWGVLAYRHLDHHLKQFGG